MIDYVVIRYSEIYVCIIDAKEGKLSSYWQGYAEREFDALRTDDGKLPERARELYKEYKRILKMSLRLNLMKLTMPLQNNMVSNYAAQDNTTCEMSSFNDISQLHCCVE